MFSKSEIHEFLFSYLTLTWRRQNIVLGLLSRLLGGGDEAHGFPAAATSHQTDRHVVAAVAVRGGAGAIGDGQPRLACEGGGGMFNSAASLRLLQLRHAKSGSGSGQLGVTRRQDGQVVT